MTTTPRRLLALGGILALLASACSSGGTATPSVAATPSQSSVASTAPSAVASASSPAASPTAEAPLNPPVDLTFMFDWGLPSEPQKLPELMAEHLGWYKAAGLNVTLQYPPVPPATKYVVAGKVDIGEMYPIDILTSLAQGAKMTVVGAKFDDLTEGLAFFNDSGITKPEDFYGKTVGIYNNATSQGLFQSFLKCHQLDASKITVHLEGNDTSALIVANKVQAIDAGATGEYLTMQHATGKPATYWNYDATQCVPNVYGWNYVVQPSFLAAHGDAVKRFLEINYLAEAYVRSHVQESLTYFNGLYPDLDPKLNAAAWYQVDHLIYPRFIPTNEPGFEDPKLWDAYQTWAINLKIIDQKVDMTPSLTNDYLPTMSADEISVLTAPPAPGNLPTP